MPLLQKPSALPTGKLHQLLQKLDRLSIFSFMWAVATLFHQMVYLRRWVSHDVVSWLLFLSAVAILWKTRSIGLLLFMLTVSAAVGLGKMPFIDNHIFFQLCADLILLLSIAWQLILQMRKGNLLQSFSGQKFREEIFDSFAPSARTALIILYFFAVFHKLNWGFFDPAYSHAVPLLEETTALVHLPLTHWMQVTAIWATLIVETCIAVMLCLKSTRNAGIIVGLAFHLMLSMNPKHVGFNSFAAMLYPLYFLFVSPDFPDRLSAMLSRIYQQWTNGKGKWIVWSGVVMTIVILSVCLLAGYRVSYGSMLNITGVAWGLFLSIIYISVTVLYPMSQAGFATLFRPRWPLQWMVPVLLLFNGMACYLGLKTTSTFNMFTNLRTEGGETNHFFMSKRVKIAGYVDDLVVITNTNHPDLKVFENKKIITYYELQRNAQKRHKNFFVEYRRNGKPMRLEVKNGMSNDPEVFVLHPWWQKKIMGFKPIDYGPHNIHRHDDKKAE
jgi:hypothetical protein